MDSKALKIKFSKHQSSVAPSLSNFWYSPNSLLLHNKITLARYVNFLTSCNVLTNKCFNNINLSSFDDIYYKAYQSEWAVGFIPKLFMAVGYDRKIACKVLVF